MILHHIDDYFLINISQAIHITSIKHYTTFIPDKKDEKTMFTSVKIVKKGGDLNSLRDT